MSDGVIVIDTKIDSSGAEKGTKNLKKEANIISNEFKRTGESSSNSFKRSWNRISRESKLGSSNVKNDLESISHIAKKCAGILAGMFILDKIKDYTMNISKAGIQYNALSEQAQVAWGTILGSNEAANKMMEEITDYAAKTPFSKMGVDAMAKQLSNAGFKGQDLFNQLTKFGDMGSAFGIQEDSLKEMVRQYAQVQQAQVAYTEDLNILQDRGIPIFKALGEVMGVPVSQVKKLASEGKVTADVYNKAIDSMSNKTKGAMDGQSKTFNGMMSTLKDNLSILASELSKPLFEKMKSSIQDILPKLEEFISLVGTSGIGDAISQTFPKLKPLVDSVTELGNVLKGTIIPLLSNLGKWITENIGPISLLSTILGSIVLSFKAMSIISSIIAMIQGLSAVFGLLETATLGEAAAQWAANLAFLACPLTWIVLAIGALVGAFIYLWVTSEDFRNFWIGLWENVKNAFIYTWNTVINFFTVTIPGWIENIKQWFINLPAWFSELWESVKTWFVTKWSEIWDYLYTNVPIWIENIKQWFINLPAWFSELWESVKTWFVTKWSEIWDYLYTNVPIWIENIKQWFINLPAWFSELWESVKTWFITKWSEIWDYLCTNVPVWIDNIWQWFNSLPGKIGYALGFVIGTIIQWGLNVWNYLVTNVPVWIDNIGIWFSGLPEKIWIWLCNTFNKVVTWGSQMVNKAIEVSSNFINSVITFVSELPAKIWTWLCNTFNKVVAWGSQMVNKAIEVSSNFINSVITFVSGLPAKIWTWLCNTFNKVVVWGSQMISKAIEVSSNFINSVITFVSGLPAKIWTWLCNVVSKVATWGSNLWNAGMNAAKELVNAVIEAVCSLPGKMLDIGKNIVEGVWNGITGAAGWFKNKVYDFFGGIVTGAKEALGIKSPSRVMRDQVGKWILPGVESGIDKTMPDLQGNMKEKMLSLTKDMKAKVQFESSVLGSSIAAKSNVDILSKNTYKNNESSNKTREDSQFTIQNILDGNIIGEATYRIVDNKLALASRRRL